MICKLVYRKQIHLYSNLQDYRSLLSFLASTFSNVPRYFELTYSDEEGDEIMLSNQEDLEVFKLIHANTKRFPKITVKECEPPKQSTACCGPDDSFEEICQVDAQKSEEQPADISKEVEDNSRRISARAQALVLKEEEELIHDLVGCNLRLLARHAEAAVKKMEDEMTEDLVRLNSESMSLRVASKLAREEEQLVKDLAKEAVQRITLSSIDKYLSMVSEPSRPVYRPYRSKSSEFRQNCDIEKMIDRKVRQLLPTIIERVTTAVERRMSRQRLQEFAPKFNRSSYENEEEYCDMQRPNFCRSVRFPPRAIYRPA